MPWGWMHVEQEAVLAMAGYSTASSVLTNGTDRELRHVGHSMSSEPNFEHSDPRIKLSICEAKIMKSFGDFFFKILKIQISNIQ
jgi:hypothetical protein